MCLSVAQTLGQPAARIQAGATLDTLAVQRHAGLLGAAQIVVGEGIARRGFDAQLAAQLEVAGHEIHARGTVSWTSSWFLPGNEKAFFRLGVVCVCISGSWGWGSGGRGFAVKNTLAIEDCGLE